MYFLFRRRVLVILFALLIILLLWPPNQAFAGSCLCNGKSSYFISKEDNGLIVNECKRQKKNGTVIFNQQNCDVDSTLWYPHSEKKDVKCAYFNDNECNNLSTIPCGEGANKETCQQVDKICDPNIKDVCAGLGGGREFGPDICSVRYCYLSNTRYLRYQQQPGLFSVKSDLQIKKPFLEISLPNLTFSDVQKTLTTDEDDNVYINAPYIGEYLSAAYKFAMVAGSIVAVVMIIVMGLRVVTSLGGEQKAEAYKRIGQIVIGLAILWGSYFILFSINPDLVSFKALKVRYIEGEPLPEENENFDDTTYQTSDSIAAPTWSYKTFDCSKKESYSPMGMAPESSLDKNYSCPGILGTITTVKEMHEPLCKVAAKALQEGYSLQIAPLGSYRPFKDQVRGWCKDMIKYKSLEEEKKFRAPPGFSRHGLGRAVDVVLIKNGTELFKISTRDQCNVDPGVVAKLTSFFYSTDKKFLRLNSEIWHFEYGTQPDQTRQQFTTKPSFCK